MIGVVNSDGLVTILADPLPVDAEFAAEASRGRQPEQRFRFANKCVQSGCKQWSAGACGVIKKIAGALESADLDHTTLPACGIRKTCRWFFQEGAKACAICPLVITDST